MFFDLRRKEETMSTKILDLMQVPAEEHGLEWLRQSLQAAIELEFATIPVYLCGLWSIADQSGLVHDAIRGVTIDEMFHFGLACNMLTTIGGNPKLNTADAIPKYRGPLPGGVRPWLRVALTGLSKPVVEKMYMEIEYPENGPIVMFRGESYTTIGEFYDAILAAFRKLTASEITGARQVTRGSRLFAIKSLADAERAIERIKREGEGTSQSPFSDDIGMKPAHYYKFAEIFRGRKLKEVAPRVWKYEGEELPFPAVLPVAEVPEEGYPGEPKAAEFNRVYTSMLNHLQNAWMTGTSSELGEAVGVMFEMAGPARELMEKPRPDGSGNFCPDFRLVAT